MIEPWPRIEEHLPSTRPDEPPPRWRPLIGAYGSESSPHVVFEAGGVLCLQRHRHSALPLTEQAPDRFIDRGGSTVVFARTGSGAVSGLTLGDAVHARLALGPGAGIEQMLISPTASIDDVLRDAQSVAAPAETGTCRDDELVDVAALEPSLRLDLRYASTNNFLGAVFYDEGRALLQRPVAEALVRVHQSLRTHGYGVTVFDAYRPWFVTKAFWEATPAAQRWMVANPANGSKHNRGAAVDVTLHDVTTGTPVVMPSTFDEPTPRAYAFYPGGTSVQRWHRSLLRRAMEAEGFVLNLFEWWHFDHADWRAYRIGNRPIGDVR